MAQDCPSYDEAHVNKDYDVETFEEQANGKRVVDDQDGDDEGNEERVDDNVHEFQWHGGDVVVEASQRHEQVIGETQALPIMMKSLHGRTHQPLTMSGIMIPPLTSKERRQLDTTSVVVLDVGIFVRGHQFNKACVS